LNDLEPQKYGF